MKKGSRQKKDEKDWYDTLPTDIAASVRRAMKEINNGKGIPHEQIKKMYPEWFKR